MPRYDFACEAGHRFELELPFGSSLEQPCIRCDRTARRGFNPPRFRYRGMGFYTTDTRKNYRKPEKDPESSGRSGDPPDGDWPKQDETKHGDSDASTAGIVRGSKPREAAESAAGQDGPPRRRRSGGQRRRRSSTS